jgi:hypothetical protein
MCTWDSTAGNRSLLQAAGRRQCAGRAAPVSGGLSSPRPAAAALGARAILKQNMKEIKRLLIRYGRFLKFILQTTHNLPKFKGKILDFPDPVV